MNRAHEVSLSNPYDGISRPARRRLTDRLVRVAATTQGDARRRVLDRIVLVNMCVAQTIAAGYRRRGIPSADLDQVAYCALVRAVRDFDPDSGNNLLSYLVPSVRGELRRHFRDLGWTVRPPRRVQELQSQVVQERDNLPASLTAGEGTQVIADRLGVSRHEVDEALSAQGCFSPSSLDAIVGEDGSATLGSLVPCPRASGEREAAEARVMLGGAVGTLSHRDQRLVQLRFVEGLSQQEIAEDFAVTQAQVSRLLARVLDKLRAQLGSKQLDPAAA